jgi:uncharacterized Zn finger protein (UPF0148 family)
VTKIKCPHCSNEDSTLLEVLKGGRILCSVCGKTFRKESSEVYPYKSELIGQKIPGDP